MSTDKGKGKDKSSASKQTPNSKEDEDPSMLSRIAASANGLTRNISSGPSNNDSMVASLANSGKGHSSSSSGSTASTWTANSIKQNPNHVLPNGLASVKSGHSEEHERVSEQEFASFLDGIDTFTPSEPSGTMGVDSYKDIGATWGQAWAHAQTIEPQESVSSAAPNRTVAEQEAQDGQEVLDLLSSTGWISKEFEALPEDQAPEDYTWGLSPEQISQIKIMTRHLGIPVSHMGVDINHPLNLVPELDTESREHWKWIVEWEGVLTRYSDEVWGSLLPLVQEARQEVEEIREQYTIPERPTAVRRLEAILGHLRRS